VSILINDPTPTAAPPSLDGVKLKKRRTRMFFRDSYSRVFRFPHSNSAHLLFAEKTGANLKAHFFLYEGIPRVLYRTTRLIEAGEELLVDYNNEENSISRTIENMNDLVRQNFILRGMQYAKDPKKFSNPETPVFLSGILNCSL
jgi:hypothetical protein